MPDKPVLSSADRSRFEHMLKAAHDAIAVLGALSLDELTADMVRARALVNCFTEIGEAASRTSNEARGLAAEIPWRQIVGMRHNLVHVYWGIDLSELVKTLREDLPDFIAAIERVLAKSDAA